MKTHPVGCGHRRARSAGETGVMGGCEARLGWAYPTPFGRIPHRTREPDTSLVTRLVSRGYGRQTEKLARVLRVVIWRITSSCLSRMAFPQMAPAAEPPALSALDHPRRCLEGRQEQAGEPHTNRRHLPPPARYTPSAVVARPRRNWARTLNH